MKDSAQRTLSIASTWNGLSIPEREKATIRLVLSEAALEIAVDAPYFGDPPPPGPVGPTTGLWHYEVVEVFVAHLSPQRPPVYTEIELSPHGHFLLLRLEGIRQVVDSSRDLDYAATIAGQHWQGRALLPRDLLPPLPHRVNAFSIHGEGTKRRFLAHRPLPGETPDFHQPDHFAAFP